MDRELGVRIEIVQLKSGKFQKRNVIYTIWNALVFMLAFGGEVLWLTVSVVCLWELLIVTCFDGMLLQK